MRNPALWSDRILPVALLVLAAVLVFTNLGGGGLRNGDEARYAIVAQEILHTGDPVTLHYEGQPYFQKAPLRFWISAATYRLFGAGEFTVRFWSALAGLGCVVATWWLGRRLWGPWAGLAAALVLMTTPAFLHVHGARTGEMDTLVTLCWLLALVPLTGERLGRSGFLTACFFAALCGMTKHLAFAPLAFITLGLGLLATGRWRDLTRLWLLEGAAIALMVAAPWHLIQWSMHGNLFWEVYLGRVVVETAFNFAGPQPGAGYYPEVMFAGGWPWPFLWAAGLARALASVRRRPAVLLPVIMIAVTLLFTVVAQRKLAWYVIPAYPALALLAGGVIAAGARAQRPFEGLGGLILAWTAFAAFLIGPMTWLFADRPAYQVPLDAEFFFTLMPRPGGLWGMGILFALSVSAGFLAPRRAEAAARRPALIGALVLTVLAGIFAVRNTAGPLAIRVEPPAKTAVAELNENLDPEKTVVIGLHRDRPRDDVSLFYLYQLEGKIRRASPAQARAYLAEDRFEGLVIVPDDGKPTRGGTLVKRTAGLLFLSKQR